MHRFLGNDYAGMEHLAPPGVKALKAYLKGILGHLTSNN